MRREVPFTVQAAPRYERLRRLDFLYHSAQGTTEYGQHRALILRQYVSSSVTTARVTIVRADVQQYSFSVVSGGGLAPKRREC